MRFVKASEVDLLLIVNLVDEIFRDYTIPIRWTVSSFKKDIVENSIVLEDSIIVFDNDEPVGFSIVSERGTRGRIDAFGVKEKYRGKGLASEILSSTIEKFKWKGITTVVLEVVEREKRAVKFYRKHGFKIKRNLYTIFRSLEDLEEKPKLGYAKENNRWIHDRMVEALHAIGRKPNWQREPKTIELSGNRYILECISSKGFRIGYIVWGYNEENAFIVDVSPVFDKTRYEEIFIDSLKHIKEVSKKDEVLIVSLPEDDPLFEISKKHGFEPVITQYEMIKKIH